MLTFVWPIAAIIFAGINLVARTIFGILYHRSPKARGKIGPLMVINTFFTMVVAICACIYWQTQLPSW